MGVFEFIIVLVLISTVGKVLSQRLPRERRQAHPPPLPPGQVEGIQEALEDLSARVVRLEEERDFYRELLESPERNRGTLGPGGEGDFTEDEDGF